MTFPLDEGFELWEYRCRQTSIFPRPCRIMWPALSGGFRVSGLSGSLLVPVVESWRKSDAPTRHWKRIRGVRQPQRIGL